MKNKIKIFLVLMLLLAASVIAQYPTKLSVQGMLKNSSTGALISSADLRIEIADSSGNVIFNHSYPSAVSSGRFDILAGDTYELNLSYNADYNLSIYAGTSTTPIGGPYRFRGGQGEISAEDVKFDSDMVFDSADNTLFVNATSNRVGIGTDSPTQTLNVIGTVNATAFIGDGSGLTGISGGGVSRWNLTGSNLYPENLDYAVGIGTDSPSQRLHVAGNANITGTVYAQNFSSNSPLRLQTAGTTRLFIDDTTGNVGIGTTGPTSPLHVFSTGGGAGIDIDSGDENPSFRLSENGNNKWSVGYNINQNLFKISEVGVADRLVIGDTSGNVGINTTSPTQTLTVIGTVNATSFVGDGTGITGITASGDGTGGWVNDSATTSTSLNVNITSGRLTVVNGNVGIGTASPAKELDIVSSDTGTTIGLNNTAGNKWVIHSIGNVAGRSGHFEVDQVATSGVEFTIENGTGNVGIGTTTPGQKMVVAGDANITGNFYAGAGASPVLSVDDANDRVGIGTASPVTKLEVLASGSYGPLVKFGSAGATDYESIMLYNGAGNTSLFVAGGSGQFVPGTAAGDGGYRVSVGKKMVFGVLNASWIVIDDGNVGIGTTSPGEKLSINGSLRVDNATGSALLFVNATSGYVGIGTSNPYVKLEVSGSVYAGNGNDTGFGPATCPAGMIPVPPTNGRDGFCVDKYEAKQSGSVAVSQASGTPWVSITQYDARKACIVAGKHLITEPEWLQIAQNAEQVGWNWNGSVVGANNMSDGHSDNSPASALAANSSDAFPCSGTGQACNETDWNSQRRNYRLSNDETIWDFGGNVWEWTDQFTYAKYPVNNDWSAWAACANPDGICGNTLTTNDQRYGEITDSLRAFRRGGHWDNGASSGVFTLALNSSPSSSYTTVGFRCAR